MKKFISIIIMFILLVTSLSVSVSAEINEAELLEVFKSSHLTPAKTDKYEHIVIDKAKDTMGEDYKVMLLSSGVHEDVYIYAFIPKNNKLLYIAKDAYGGDTESIQLWNEFTGVLRKTSVDIQELASTLTENKYAIMILNPKDYKYVMWMAFDGEIAYDHVNRINNANILFN